MSKFRAIEALCVIFFLAINLNISAGSGDDFFPITPTYKKEITSFHYANTSQGYTLAAASLQGLVNRDTARILLSDNLTQGQTDLYLANGDITSINKYSNIYFLLRDFKDYYSGAVVYDPDNKFTINLATNIAGVENRVIISPDMIANFKGYTGIEDIKDLRDNNFSSRYDAYLWYEKYILPYQRKDVLAVANDHFMHDVYRDYLIEFKIPTFWLPGQTDEDYDYRHQEKIIELFQQTPVNIPVLGFWPDADGNGYEEYSGVKLAGKYGKFTVVNTWVGNYSFHTAVHSQFNYSQRAVRNKTFREYDSEKKYVALIMIESGDSPGYMQYGFTQRQWSDPIRGQVPISFGIDPSMRFLLPAYTKHLYETATENDFFFTSISGAGYCYPFEGYGTLTSNPDQTLRDYFDLTSSNMRMMDLDMLGLYTHPNTTSGQWTSSDLSVFTNYIEDMPGLNSVISGMHRTGYIGANGNAHYNNYGKDITVHHTMTFWPSVDYKWDDLSQDQAAVDFLENEIKTYGAGANFTQAMFYSWIYGPRRLKMLQDQMAADGYVFVNLNEFDYLYRISENLTPQVTHKTWIIREEAGDGVDFTGISAAIEDSRVLSGDILDILGTFTEQEIQVTKSLSFIGHGKDKTIIQAAENTLSATGRVFYYNQFPGVENLSFENMTIRNGNTTGEGGGIYILGQVDLTLTNVAISDNNANGNGAGVYFWGRALEVDGCEFTANETQARYAGLNIWLQQGYAIEADIYNSYFGENVAADHGGAVGITKVWTTNADCKIDFQNTTFYSNSSKSGSAVWLEVTKETPQSNYPTGLCDLKLTNCTFLGNRNTEEGWSGVLHLWTPEVTILHAYNNLFSDNTNLNSASSNEDYDLWISDNLLEAGFYNNIGNNLLIPEIYNSTSANNTLSATSDEIALESVPLQNSGMVKTLALHENSIAIEYVTDHNLYTDARGFPRKEPFSDCGAFESERLFTGLSIRKLDQDHISVYPNPVSNTLYFSEEIKGSILIYDLVGILRETFPEGFYRQISMDSLQSGIYFLVIRSNTEALNKAIKILKR